jgi:transposase
MEESITWVGIDAHKKTLAVAAFQRPGQEPEEFTIDNDERAIRKLVRRLERDGDGREIRICYEAGTCGYALQRRLEATGGVVCEVIAPSLVPRKPGERIKTDRPFRDTDCGPPCSLSPLCRPYSLIIAARL